MKVLTTVVACIILGSSGLVEARTRLLVNCFWPSSHFACSEILPAWIEEVERVTDGRVKGNIPPKSVAPPPEQLAAVEKGITDVAVIFNGLIQNRVSGPLVAMQPFSGNRSAEKMSKALWATNQQYFPDEFDTVKLLSQFVISPTQPYSQTETPINSVDDLASRKMWILPGPLSAIAKNLGSGVVSTPAVKANEIISRGVVDGHLGLDPQAVQAFQLIPYTRSMTRFAQPIYSTSFSVFINKDTWASISEEDRAAIMSVSADVLGALFGARWDKAAESAEAAFVEAGMDIIDADPAFESALREASVFVTEEWIKTATEAGINAVEALDFYRSTLDEQ